MRGLPWTQGTGTRTKTSYLREAVFSKHVQQCAFPALTVSDNHDLTVERSVSVHPDRRKDPRRPEPVPVPQLQASSSALGGS